MLGLSLVMHLEPSTDVCQLPHLARLLPMPSASSKHLMERELAMEVLLNHIQPLGVPRSPFQLLQGDSRDYLRAGES